jgi:imidazolonepropionase-like amidohydrolase
MFGQNARELRGRVNAGMTPAQAPAATTTGAALLGIKESLGRISPGYYADITAVEGDPLSDIEVVINPVEWVMKNGAVVVDKQIRRECRELGLWQSKKNLTMQTAGEHFCAI